MRVKHAQRKCVVLDYLPNQRTPCAQAMLGGQLTCSQLVGAYLQVIFRYFHAWQHLCGLLCNFWCAKNTGKFL